MAPSPWLAARSRLAHRAAANGLQNTTGSWKSKLNLVRPARSHARFHEAARNRALRTIGTVMDLRDYERIKFELAGILRALPFDATQFERRRNLFARLAEDRFNLVVVGRFSRGKSSLMNAILGMDRLPTGVVPLTSVITTVTYGSEDRVTLHYRASSLIDDVKLGELAKYITERGNPGNIRGIEIAEVQLPAAILRRGFHFIDTPGLGSSIRENSRTTEAFMPEADALILVTSFDSPLSEEEMAVLRAARRGGRRVFLVINKLDAVSEVERDQVHAHITAQVGTLFGENPPATFPVSARDALAAKLARNRAALEASGIAAMEQALIDFLVSGKRMEFLLSMCGRIRDAVAAAPDAGSGRAHLDQLQAAIVASSSAPAAARHAEADPELASDIPPCEVCLRVQQAVFSHMTSLQSRVGKDPGARTELADRHGLCAVHAELFETIAAPREVCVAFAGVLEAQAAHLRALAADRRAGSRVWEAVQQILPDGHRCPACDVAAAMQSSTAASLACRLVAAGTVVPRRFPAICLPHLVPVLAALTDPAARERLLLRQADILDRFANDMRRFTLKQDASQRWALNKEELGAAQRGSRLLVGAPASHFPVARSQQPD